MADCKPISTPMEVRHIDAERDQFRPAEQGEEILGENYPYLSAIGALMYLANQTRPDIAFAVNLLARHSRKPCKRHWVGIQRVFRYLRGTQDVGLFFERNSKTPGLVGYADAGFLSDPTNCKSQSGYVFLLNGTAISWKSQKQSLTAASTCYAELIALYEATKECIWLRRMINQIYSISGFPEIQEPTIVYEDNEACIKMIQEGFIKGENTKHIATRFFTIKENTHELEVVRVASAENLADIFTKSLGSGLHRKLMMGLNMRSLKDLNALNASKQSGS
jgi:hypothetical protein